MERNDAGCMDSGGHAWLVEPLEMSGGADLAIVDPTNGYVVAEVRHDPDIQDQDEPGRAVVLLQRDFENAAVLAAAPLLRRALTNLVGELERAGHALAFDHEARVALRTAHFDHLAGLAGTYRTAPAAST